MTPSRLYHRRPACVLVSAPTATLASQGQRALLLVRCKPRFASTIPLRESGSNLRRSGDRSWRPGETQAGRLCYFGLTAVPTFLAEGAALPPLTWCVIPPLPSSKYPNPGGTSCLATISLSLRDKSHSPIEAPHRSAYGV